MIVELFISPLQETFFQKALIGGSMVAIVCGVVGCLVVLRKMSFLGDALSHAMIAGVAGGYLFMKLMFNIEAHAPSMLLGSLITAVLTVVLIGFVSRMSRIKEDTAIGIMYTGVFAGGVVMVSIFRNYIHIDLMHFIMGDILGVADADLWISAVASSIVLSVIIIFFRHFQLTSFDPVMAASIGMPVLLIDYILTTCVSLVVVSAVSMVGVILVVGLLITPAATAYLLSDRLDRMMILAAVFGVTSVIGGLYLCVWLDSSGGGAMMLFCTLQFLCVLFFAPKYGILAKWIQLRRMVPQQILEDVLGILVRKQTASVEEIKADLPPRFHTGVRKSGKSRRAVSHLVNQGFVEIKNNLVQLTESGKTEANRILRAHRLWETYLQHVGTPEHTIHSKAHELEHMNDAGAVEYLDDLLAHPDKDPHGKEIPEDHSCLIPGSIIPLSMMRERKQAVVAAIGDKGLNSGLEPEESIRIISRKDNGNTWVIALQNGKEIQINHSVADAIFVKI